MSITTRSSALMVLTSENIKTDSQERGGAQNGKRCRCCIVCALRDHDDPLLGEIFQHRPVYCTEPGSIVAVRLVVSEISDLVANDSHDIRIKVGEFVKANLCSCRRQQGDCFAIAYNQRLQRLRRDFQCFTGLVCFF